MFFFMYTCKKTILFSSIFLVCKKNILDRISTKSPRILEVQPWTPTNEVQGVSWRNYLLNLVEKILYNSKFLYVCLALSP